MNSNQNNPFNLVSENSESDLKRDLRQRGESLIEHSLARMEATLGKRVTAMCLGRGLVDLEQCERAIRLDIITENLFRGAGGRRLVNHSIDRQRKERAVSLELAGPWENDQFEDLRALMRPVGALVAPPATDVTPRFVGREVEMTYTLVEPGKEPEPVVSFGWPPEGHQSVTATYQLEGLVNDPKSRRAGYGGVQRDIIAFLDQALAETGRTMDDVILVGAVAPIRRASHFDYTFFDECCPVTPVVELSRHAGERHRQVSSRLTSSRSRAGKAARWSS